MKKLTLALLVFWVFVLLAVFPRLAVGAPTRVAVIGDSGSDEYQGVDNRGGSYHATTFNWLEQAVRSGQVDADVWGTRPEPRRDGYEYNAARSGAKAADAPGQADLVKTFNVDLVVISIGSGDLEQAFVPLYTGQLAGTTLQMWQAGIVSNIQSAILKVKPKLTRLVLLADLTLHPLIVNNPMYNDPNRLKYVHDAIETINNSLTQVAAANGVSVVSSSAFISALYSTPNLPFNPLTVGDSPENGLLNDLHPGTRWSCYYANFVLANVLSPLSCAVANPTPTPASLILTADYYTTPKNTSVTVLNADLLRNDQGSGLQIVNGAPPLHGTVTPLSGGIGGVYRPNTGYVGQDNFTYTAQDSLGRTATARVYVQVGP